MTIAEKAAELAEALRTVTLPGFRVYPDVGPGVSPPGAVVGAPTFRWETGSAAPTSARWPVWLVVTAGDRAAQHLWELLPPVTEALDGVLDAAVVEASPGTYPTSGGDLPAYIIEIEVNL